MDFSASEFNTPIVVSNGSPKIKFNLYDDGNGAPYPRSIEGRWEGERAGGIRFLNSEETAVVDGFATPGSYVIVEIDPAALGEGFDRLMLSVDGGDPFVLTSVPPIVSYRNA